MFTSSELFEESCPIQPLEQKSFLNETASICTVPSGLDALTWSL